MADVVIFELHSAILRAMVCDGIRMWTSLRGAWRCCSVCVRPWRLEPKMLKKLILADSAFAVFCHVSSVSGEDEALTLPWLHVAVAPFTRVRQPALMSRFHKLSSSLSKCPPKVMECGPINPSAPMRKSCKKSLKESKMSSRNGFLRSCCEQMVDILISQVAEQIIGGAPSILLRRSFLRLLKRLLQ